MPNSEDIKYMIKIHEKAIEKLKSGKVANTIILNTLKNDDGKYVHTASFSGNFSLDDLYGLQVVAINSIERNIDKINNKWFSTRDDKITKH